MILRSDSPDAEIVLAHDTGKQVARGRVLVALSVLAWSTAGIFTKGVEADVWTVLLWRGLLAGGVMSAWLVWRQGQAGLAAWKHLRRVDDELRWDGGVFRVEQQGLLRGQVPVLSESRRAIRRAEFPQAREPGGRVAGSDVRAGGDQPTVRFFVGRACDKMSKEKT